MKQLSAATGAPIRVLVTDDSPIYRRLISDALTKLPNVEVVGTSFDGEDCLRMLEKLKPHFVTLDINMPRRDGLSTLEEIRKRGLDTHVVMVSSPTPQSAEQTMRALRNGALDMIFKPEGDDIQSNRKSLEMQLFQQVETVRSLAKSALVRSNLTRNNTVVRSTLSGPTREPNRSMHHADPRPTHSPSATRKGIFECLCIGISTGGPAALGVVLPGLPARLPVPIFIVQHMPAMFTKSLAEHLAQLCSIRVSEAVHGERPEPGHAYIAPGGKQMKIVKSGGMPRIEITDEEYNSPSKPSVDCLFESVHSVFGKSTLALIMTGMGCDGLRASRMLYSAGAHIIAQSADTCVVYGMPRQIVDNHLASEVVPLPMMATRIGELLRDRK